MTRYGGKTGHKFPTHLGWGSDDLTERGLLQKSIKKQKEGMGGQTTSHFEKEGINPRTFSYEQFEERVFSNKKVFSDDLIQDQGYTYKAQDILQSIRDLGVSEEAFNKLPHKKRAKLARQSRKNLRRKHQLENTVLGDPHMLGEHGTNKTMRDISESIIEHGTKETIADSVENNIRQKPFQCSICKKLIHGEYSNNAMPINDGRCCRDCNSKYVTPARISGAYQQMPNRDWMITPEEIKGADESFVKRYKGAAEKIKRWITSDNFVLEKPAGSSLHHLADYSCKHGNGSFSEAIKPGGWMTDLQAFVVEHNWAVAFDTAKDFHSGEFHIPYPHCAFEFRISGMRCVFLFYGNDEAGHLACPSIMVGCDDIWLLMPQCFDITSSGAIVLEPTHEHPDPGILNLRDTAFIPLYALAFKQIRAVCIMLESEIATKQTIRAPERLNRNREKMGRTKLRDYHIVTLNRKPHSDKLPIELQTHGERHSPRLHFRSGHWRHFPSHRTWIHWQLIGNPDLGFVDKHYRL